jgi:hypothetical protein
MMKRSMASYNATGENMPIRVWQVIENGADAQGRVRNRGRYPSAWLANNKARRLRGKRQPATSRRPRLPTTNCATFLVAVLRSCGGAS